MAGKYRAYPEYKSAGVEWLGVIPLHWKVTSLRFLLKSMRNGSTATQVEELENAVAISRIESISTGEINFDKVGYVDPKTISDSFNINQGDILLSHINSLSMVGNVALKRDSTRLYHGMNLLRLIPDKYKVDSNYLYWIIKSTYTRQSIEAVAKPAINQASVSTASLKSIQLLSPSLLEQTLIANFLDHETAKIDTLIEKQQQLIKLLKEKRQAVISHAVTKGLNPDAPMRDSGVEWLGEVPAHWDVSRVKFEYKNLDGRRIPLSTEERSYKQGEYAYYGASGVIDHVDDYIFDEDLVLVSEDGANLLMRSYPIAFPAYGRYWVNNHAHILKPKDNNIEFWAEVIEVRDLTPYISGAAQPKFTSEALSNLEIATPANEEVKEIAFYIREQKEKYSLLIGKSEGSIKLMQERRSALISAAVTGKIDVRNWQAPQQKQNHKEEVA